MYWLNDGKRRRYFVIPPKTKTSNQAYNTFVYGGIFVINDFNEYERALYSYYNSSISYVGESLQEDLYLPTSSITTPIQFNTLKELEECRYNKLESVPLITMMANQNHEKVKNSISKGRYYRRLSGFDVVSFLTMIKENGE